MHLFWLVLFVPAVFLAQWIWPILKQRSIWSVGAVVIAAVIAIWLAMGIPTLGGQRGLEAILKMFAFRIVAFTDLPLVQLLAACCVGWFRSGRVQASPPKPEAESAMKQAAVTDGKPYHSTP